ncbi:transmembrane protein 94 [Hyalella azteca]|uniref:Transmembrane protein 94 n=2 Tax=Pancrustacea TaxID=197562 RepID=A0A979FN89_HYAAZ|nr:transmembrane protein 94 [Hyalella azteca]
MEEIPKGRTTYEALTHLHDDLNSVIQDHIYPNRWKLWHTVLLEAFGHRSTLSVFRWPAGVAFLCAALVFLIVGLLDSNSIRFSCVAGVGLLLMLLWCLDVTIVLREAYLRHSEMTTLASDLLALIKSEAGYTEWSARHYPHLHSPQSPCISLQWCVRDGMVVNLPAALLVAGDTVMLRPGQKLMADCVPMGPHNEPLAECGTLLAGSIYSTSVEGQSGEALASPKVRLPNVPKAHRVLQTPFVPVLRTLLQEAAQRPVSVHQKQRNVMAWVMEAILVPVLLVTCMLVNGTRLYYGVWLNSALSPHPSYYSLPYNSSHVTSLPSHDSAGLVATESPSDPVTETGGQSCFSDAASTGESLACGDLMEALFLVPFCVVLPLLPLLLPCVWSVFRIVSSSIVLSLHASAAGKTSHSHSADASNGLGRKRRGSGHSDGGEGQDSAHLCPPDPPSPTEDGSRGSDSPKLGAVRWSEVWPHVLQLALGRPNTCVRSSNLLHVLASLTSKTNLHSSSGSLAADEDAFSDNLVSVGRGNTDGADISTLPSANTVSPEFPDHLPPAVESEPILLSLTHDHATPFGLSFDEPLWRDFLGSLKPLGLSVLLNTCHPDTQAHYTAFCGHLANEAAYTQDLVPVSQRRCLCELARQMGFSLTAQDPFKLEHQLSVFRHVPSELASKGRLARSLMVSKLKFPFPHLVSVLMRDANTHKLELLTQGTADIVLDSCSDYWDGSDLTPLTDKDRKKLLEFYQRTALSAYCTAFSYRPSPCVVNTELTHLYMELPTDPAHLYTRSPTPYNSTEALFGDEAHTEYEEVNDVDDLFHMQCKQIFIGMVTMQYQAKIDMVQLIEQLESACIRFVHFSKENELRSRVFSEKMGLESGWNCHISLLDDKNKGSGDGSAACASLRASGQSLPRACKETLTAASARPKSSQRSKSLKRRLVPGKSALHGMKVRSHSAPAAINVEAEGVRCEDDGSVCSSVSSSVLHRHLGSYKTRAGVHGHRDTPTDATVTIGIEEFSGETEVDEPEGQDDRFLKDPLKDFHHPSYSSREPSHTTESSDHSTCFNFDMSNRARLPKGINNIRPHLKDVDNVPLLVSLFTDCTASATQQMLEIMQENDEVVLVMGSSANFDNVPLFVRSDASVGVEPLYPVVCMRERVFEEPSCALSPTKLATRLHCLPAALHFTSSPLSLVPLIEKARHLVQCSNNCLQFWAGCCCTLVLLQLLALLAVLPPALHAVDVSFLVLVTLPLLTLSLLATPHNPEVMKIATGKNILAPNSQLLRYVCTHYGSKFLPSLFVLLLCSGLALRSFCHSVGGRHSTSSASSNGDSANVSTSPTGDTSYVTVPSSIEIDLNDAALNASSSNETLIEKLAPAAAIVEPSAQCFYVYRVAYDKQGEQQLVGWGPHYAASVRGVQCWTAFVFLSYMCVVSVSFVHRSSQVWKKNPFTNVVWAVTVPLVVTLQLLYTWLVCGDAATAPARAAEAGLTALPDEAWLTALLWGLLLLPINELLKRMEIRANVRYQKRARLEFGTKLGMNSPF